MRLTFLLILIFSITNLCAQSSGKTEKWFGISNSFAKNKSTNTTVFLADSSIRVDKGWLDKQFSIGFYYRRISEKGIYQQYDLFEMAWKKNKNEVKVDKGMGVNGPIKGTDVKIFNVLLGYQVGKLFKITPKFKADIGIRTFFWYQKADTIPLSAISSPFETKSLAVGVNLALGIYYQIHEKINIGFSVIPGSITVFWNEVYLDNPVLTTRARYRRNTDYNGNLFKPLFGFKNIKVSYIF